MTAVGIVANPAAGKDIRRLVAHGRVVPDWEKVNIIRRVLLGLEAAGVRHVVTMPDPSRLCERAREDPSLSLDLDILEFPVYGTIDDTIRASAMMEEMGVGCLVTLGGDGTNRAVAKACGKVPLAPIATGTNNVFPTMIEGTLAGLAAGLVARGLVDLDRVTTVSKRLEIYVEGELEDLALVDVAVSRERFVASRAVWDMDTVHEVFLTRAEPTSIGLSSIGARLHLISITDDAGLHFRLGPGGTTVLAPVAPGMVAEVPIESWKVIPLDERVKVDLEACTMALDGEREFSVLPGQTMELAVTKNGPRVVMFEATLREATISGIFNLESVSNVVPPAGRGQDPT